MHSLSVCAVGILAPMRTSMHLVLPFLGALLLFFPLRLSAPVCPKCGNTTVPYPLSTSSLCGDQQYKILCNSSEGKLIFNAQSGSYPILNISSNSRQLIISSPALASDSCSSVDLHGGGLVLDKSLPFSVSGSNTFFILNCSQQILVSPLDCSSNNLCSQFLAQDTEGKPCVNKICCTFTAGGSPTLHGIGFSDKLCTAYVSVLGLNPTLPVKQWSYGTELEWDAPSEPICSSQRDCDNLSTCEREASNGTSRCLCNQGYQWTGLSGTCTDSGLLCPSGSHCGKQQHEAPLITGIVVGTLVCCMVVFIVFVVQRKRATKEARAKLTKERREILSEGSGGRSAKLYTIQEIRRATHNFAKERLLGSGGFGDVYKGVLADGTVVAVKVAKVGNMKGTEQVLNEVRILSQVNHRGLVMLLGCCVETEQPILVYEYVPNGTLLDDLNGARGVVLDWHRRLKVAVQTAEGLTYLHLAANPPIYHRDVKSSNILLDSELNAKVSDFGLSRLAHADLSHISTCAQGTLGYLDPEYYRNYQLTAKSDVYSFGVVLLELVTSQKAIEFARGEDDVNLAIYVAGKAREGRVMEVVDPWLLGRNVDTAPAALGSSSTGFDSSSTGLEFLPAPLLQARAPEPDLEGMMLVNRAAVAESIYKVAYLALWCLQDSRGDRPSMKEVAEELQCSLQALEANLRLAGSNVQLGHVSDAKMRSGIAAVAIVVDGVGAGTSSSGPMQSGSSNIFTASPCVSPR